MQMQMQMQCTVFYEYAPHRNQHRRRVRYLAVFAFTDPRRACVFMHLYMHLYMRRRDA
jgi:hypothetical protein